MGVDIHLRICKYDPKDNLWHKITLYQKEKDGYEEVYIYPGRNSEMFAAMQNEEEDNYGEFPCDNISMLSLDEEMKKEIEKIEKWCYGFKEILLSDLKYYLKDHPVVKDYDKFWEEEEEEKEIPTKFNPIEHIYNLCCSYIEIADWTFDVTPLSKYKILYWFDC